LQKINNFGNQLASYSFTKDIGFKISNIKVGPSASEPGFNIDAKQGEATVFFSAVRYLAGKGSSENLYKATFKISDGTVESLAIVKNDIGNDLVADIPASYLTRAVDTFRSVEQWRPGRINSFDITEAGINFKFGSDGRVPPWDVAIVMPITGGTEISVSPERGVASSIDVGTLDNAIDYAAMRSGNIEYNFGLSAKAADSAWIHLIAPDRPVFYRDPMTNYVCFQADCSYLGLGDVYGVQDPVSSAWTITDASGKVIPMQDAFGHQIQWSSMLEYLEVQHNKWTIHSVGIGEDVDPETGFAIAGSEHPKVDQIIFDSSNGRMVVYYDHATALFMKSVGSISGFLILRRNLNLFSRILIS